MPQIFCNKYQDREAVITAFGSNFLAVTCRKGKVTAKYVFGEGQSEPPYFELNIEKSYFEVGKVRYNFCDGQRLEFIPKWYEKWFQKTDDEQRKTITASKIEKTIINNISEKQQEFWRKIGFSS